ncbi:MAG: anion permease [Enterocloster clostridioformis]
MDCRKTTGFFRYAQIGGAAAMAFMHGAQDGQKFMGVMLGICMVNGSSNTQGVRFPLWMLLLGSAAMALGTSIGGKKIIKSVGMDMGKAGEILRAFRGYGRSFACLLGFSIFGIPVSTTHTKTTAIMGVER